MVKKQRHGSITHPEKQPRGEKSGRLAKPHSYPLGERIYNAKLSNKQALEIYERCLRGGVSKRALAREYGIAPSTLNALLRGVTWKSVTGIC